MFPRPLFFLLATAFACAPKPGADAGVAAARKTEGAETASVSEAEKKQRDERLREAVACIGKFFTYSNRPDSMAQGQWLERFKTILEPNAQLFADFLFEPKVIDAIDYLNIASTQFPTGVARQYRYIDYDHFSTGKDLSMPGGKVWFTSCTVVSTLYNGLNAEGAETRHPGGKTSRLKFEIFIRTDDNKARIINIFPN